MRLTRLDAGPTVVGMSTLSDRLVDARNSTGLTQRDAAELAGVSRATVQNVETGRGGIPKVSTLVALARVYRVDVGALLHDEDRTDPPEIAPENDRAPAPTAATR